MATYLPTVNFTPVYNFFQFSDTTTALATALTTQYPNLHVQVFPDGQNTGNALIVSNDKQVLTVPANNYVGYNLGVWTVHTPEELDGTTDSLYTAYTP